MVANDRPEIVFEVEANGAVLPSVRFAHESQGKQIGSWPSWAVLLSTAQFETTAIVRVRSAELADK